MPWRESVRPIAVAHVPVVTNSNLLHNNVATSKGLMSDVHPIGARPPVRLDGQERQPAGTGQDNGSELPRMTR